MGINCSFLSLEVIGCLFAGLCSCFMTFPLFFCWNCLLFQVYVYGRSVSPQEKRYSRDRSYSRSPAYNGSRSRSQSPVRERSPPYNGARSRSRSPVRVHTPVGGQSRSRSPIRSPERDESPSQ